MKWSLALIGAASVGCASDRDVPASKSVGDSSSEAVRAAPGPGSVASEPQIPAQEPLVRLDGTSRPAAVTVVSRGPRVHARAMRSWIRAEPRKGARKIGYLRTGASAPTTGEPAGTDGCPGGWYPVTPGGFVCVGRAATLDGEDPAVRATREYPPDHQRTLPYIYGTVRRTGPIYVRLPTPEQLEQHEPGLDERMETWLAAEGEIGASYAQHVWLGGPGEVPPPALVWKERRSEGVPWFLEDGREIPRVRKKVRPEGVVSVGTTAPRVGYSFLHTFLHAGRRYGVTTDLHVLPTDRLRPIQGSSAHGYAIGRDVKFPFAIVRMSDARFHQFPRGRRVDAGVAPYWSAVQLTGKQRFHDRRLHYETVDGKWLSDRDASRLDPAKRMPAWGKNGEKWIDVNLTKQTLVLYEGTVPVYATLISSGEAGLGDPKHTTATKRGIFRIHTKHVSATMSSDEVGEEFELRDVPYVQYFDKEGYALHGAYWHDRFGVPKSHGCINLTPEDARRIFHWTEPQVPAGWHGVLRPLTGTVMFVHP